MWTWKGGGGVSQMSMLLHKSYLVKWSTKGGGGGQKSPKNCPHGLWMPPIRLSKHRQLEVEHLFYNKNLKAARPRSGLKNIYFK